MRRCRNRPIGRRFVFASLLLIGCGDSRRVVDGSPDGNLSDGGLTDGTLFEGSVPDGAGVPSTSDYVTVASLHEGAIARTCALNGGVCHNSKEYPDFHTVSSLIAAIGAPCNLGAAKHSDVHDACEPVGDHLVISSLGVDAEIGRVLFSESVSTDQLTTATLSLASRMAATAGATASDILVRRGASTFSLGAAGISARVTDASTVTLDLSTADPNARLFLDDRVYPWNPSMLRVADVNGNGTFGHSLGMSLITPGQPLKSYLLLRLIDDSQGDLMPRQCRTWDDRATRALGCWIAGLSTGPDGSVTNAFDPIDFARCTFDPLARGRCSSSGSDGGTSRFAAVEQIFAQSCGGSGCHVSEMVAPAGNLDLTQGTARMAIVNVASSEAPSMVRVKPGDPASSYLMCKLDPLCTARTGAQMPLGSTLAASDIETIRAWISAGAP